MKKIYKRLLLFFIGIPAIFFAIIMFPQKNHLFINLVIVVFTLLAALEFRNILSQKNLVISAIEAAILGSLIPVSFTLVVSFGFSPDLILFFIIFGASSVLVSQVFIAKKSLETCVNRAAAGFSVMVYPGLFMSFMIRLSVFPNASRFILLFLMMVLLNDSLAWVTGLLFGKSNRGLIAASPNKSIAGFAGGLLFSIITGIAAVIILPDVFASKALHPVLAAVILGSGTGLAAILGDLSESALKRSSGVKDSGNVILGRGGALDSIDSLALAAPVFYILCLALFNL